MRNELQGRPLLGVLAALIVGLTARDYPFNLLLVPLLVLFWTSLEGRLWIGAALCLGILLAPRAPVPAEPRSGEFRVTVLSSPRLYEEYTSFEADVDGDRILARLPGRPVVSLGDQLTVFGRITGIRETDRFLAAKGVQGRLFATRFDVVSRSNWVFTSADRWRRSFLGFVLETVPPHVGHVIGALCFNTDSLLDDDTKDSLRRTGTIHIVSVSGMHVFVLAVSLLWVLSVAPVPRWAQLLIAGVALGFYALAVGLNPPIVRAVLMAGIGYAAYLFRREPDWLSALATAGILYLLLDPRAVYDMGFQLSFVTVAAFTLYLPARDDREASIWMGALEWLKDFARASLVASVASAPLVAYHFGEVPLLGIFANLLVALAVPAIIIGAFIAYMVWFLVPAVGEAILLWFVSGWVGYVDLVVNLLSKPQWSVIRVGEFPAYALVPIYAAALMSWRPIVRQP